MNSILFSLLCTITFAGEISSFSPAVHSLLVKLVSNTNTPTSLLLVSDGENDDIPDNSNEYSGSVDWDAEWKKVVEREGKLESGESRLGKEFYKSEAEINAIKAANKATETINDVSSTVTNSLPDVRSLSGDWRFWIGILALVSVGFSVLTAPPVNIVPTSSPESFYM